MSPYPTALRASPATVPGFTPSLPTFTGRIPTQLCRNTLPPHFHGTSSHATLKVGWEGAVADLGGNASHESWGQLALSQLLRDAFPPKLAGAPSYPAFTGHVPTQVWRISFAPVLWGAFPPKFGDGEIM